jgi:flagellar hook-associated protein 1 FlgK
MMNNLMELEILRQESSLGHVSQELTTLQTVESAFGELSTADSLSAAIDGFFNALRDLSAHPSEAIWQRQTIDAAETMAGQFRTLGEFLSTLDAQIALEADDAIDRVNALTSRVGELNGEIIKIRIAGGQANNLSDQRDQAISELSKLVKVETQNREYGVVDVAAATIPVVTGTSVTELEAGLTDDHELGVGIAGTFDYSTNVQGGQVGGLLSLRNDIAADIQSDLDALANAIIHGINKYHVQGVGTEGSFTEVSGWAMTTETLADLDPPITAGKTYIRVTDTSTGNITRYEIDIANDLPANPTLSDLADYITNNIPGLTASFGSKLIIMAGANYEFDFLPAVLGSPKSSTLNLNGTSPPAVSVSGIYTGSQNQTFTFTVSGTGSVGNGTLQINVTDGGGETVATVSVGSGYAAGDKLNVGNGLQISLSTGDLVDGDTFQVDALADTDTAGVLAATGINTFFSGNGAESIAVSSRLSQTVGYVAASLGPDMTDNANAVRLAGLAEEPTSSLGALTPGEFYQQLITNTGQQVSVKQMRRDTIANILQNLNDRRSEISGVNINDEAAQILVFEQLFQAMAKYMSTVQASLVTLFQAL